MKLIHETMSELSLFLFGEVRTREYIYFSYLIKEKSCFYCQLYRRVEIKKKNLGSQKASFFYFPYFILSYIQALNSLFFSRSGVNYICEDHNIFLQLGYGYGIVQKWKFHRGRLSEAHLSLNFSCREGKIQVRYKNNWELNVSPQSALKG